jgi:hypothetical protein
MILGRTDQEKHGWLLPIGNPKASGKDERNYYDYLYAKSHVKMSPFRIPFSEIA